MEPYNLAIKVLVDRDYLTNDRDSMFLKEIKELGGLEKALPLITQAFIEMKQRLDGNFHTNRDGELIKGFVKNLDKLELKLYVTWCDNYKNFLFHGNGSRLIAYGGKKENVPYSIIIKEGKFFIE